MPASLFRRLRRHRKGNVALMFAFAAVPLVFSVGMGIDYSAASMREDQMNAIADSAALAALRPAVLAQQTAQGSNAPLITAATNTFNAQASSVAGVTYDPSALVVTVTSTPAGATVINTVTVSYIAASHNAFAGILGKQTLTIGGSSQATSNAAPNINFYLMLDSSPSMLIAQTDEISAMRALTPKQDSGAGCAFACHETNPASENPALGNPNYPKGNPLAGQMMDNYAIARANNITLRIDLLVQAIQNLVSTAQQTASSANAQYQMAIYSFDLGLNTIQTLTSNLTLAQSQASNINVREVYVNNYLTQNNKNSDEDTNFDTAFTQINSIMPNPGNGTNAAGDSPQEVLFIVTDGMEDENVGGTRTYAFTAGNTCTAIKNRGIRIAILYTYYSTLPTDSFYNTNVAQYQPGVATSMQNCASPNLYLEADSDTNISSYLKSLFQTAVTTAYLSK